MIAEVIVDISNSEVDRIFEYRCERDDIAAGSRVSVPFGKRTVEGYVVRVKETSEYPEDKLKDIIEPLDPYPVVLPEMLELMRFMADRYHLRLADVLKLFIPAGRRGGRVRELVRQYAHINPEFLHRDEATFIRPSAKAQLEVFRYLADNGSVSVTELNREFSASALKNLIMRDIVRVEDVEVKRTPYRYMECGDNAVTLTEEQAAAVSCITGGKGVFLLHGVTGSGKTEVYMRCISEALAKGKTAIMLVPEISLTPQVLKNFRRRFGENVAILHSGLSEGERFDEWRRLLTGEAQVAVGARSAVFAPLTDIGVIIIDEEHDASYLSERNPRYPTHEIARFRARYNGCNLILGSATPSVESYYRAERGEYRLVALKNRVNLRPLPDMEIVDMRAELKNGNPGFLSAALQSELAACIEAGNQAILFINRRGYASYVMCRSCGYVAKCEQCDVSLVYHKDENVLKCHYCNNRYAMLDVCPQCGSPHVKHGFMGTQKVAEQLQALFPGTGILRMDNDTTQGKDAHFNILHAFAEHRAQILVGTQMVAKGHDFPDVTLVGVLDADMSLHFADFRSAERTYQLITQVAGRAGRDRKAGKVILQTYTPNHYVYKFAAENDYEGFYAKEINLREVTKYPPFTDIVRLLIGSEDESAAAAALKKAAGRITAYAKDNDDFVYLGVMRSPVKKKQNVYRMQIIVRLRPAAEAAVRELFAAADEAESSNVSCFVEINPNDLR